MQPIKVWLMPSGPNPWKAVLALESLQIPHEIKSISFADSKRKPFIEVNPNGKVPAIEDPNTGVTLWESGAIIQYVVEQYDTNHVISYEGVRDRHLCNQWLMFQMSGQGPYFGQSSWFNNLHPEKLPSAIERYNAEVHRIFSILEGRLQDSTWLVGDKMTFADLAFVPWDVMIDQAMHTSGPPPVSGQLRDGGILDGYPKVKAWHKRMVGFDAFERTWVARAKCMEEQGIDPATGLPKGQTLQGELSKIEVEEAGR